MKYAIIIPDGCADWAVESLGGRTPLQAARTPNLDSLAKTGIIGRSQNVPAGMPPGSDVATLGLLGYNPSQYYTGRAPLEAAAQGIELQTNDWAIRCNLVTIENNVMKSFTAGHISSGEAKTLIDALNDALFNKVAPASPIGLQFYAGVSYRNLVIARDRVPLSENTKTYPPHDYTDQKIDSVLPSGDGNLFLRDLMDASRRIFAKHSVNLQRIESGKLPATQIWLWGIGQKPQLPLFADRFSSTPIRGAMITAVDLLRGIASLIGWDIINVPGITGYVDTDFAAKGNYAAEALKDHDLVCVHVEATDEAGHEGSVEKKVKAMEDIDALVIPPVLEALKSYGDWRLFVSPDHPTPVAIKTHTSDYVPWLLAGNDLTTLTSTSTASASGYDEETARNSRFRYDNGWEMLGQLFIRK
ncbi:MAG: cofactor-independent phosphoglycerate mutase [Planctomycetaceae bacterium]|jgi:2,3-bisphosphoglycerate-independent phosphoglycerate mutase|nr:cofactor-independent phosphoglycerate mutase [Planctomycetaceae bacterium]